MELDDTLVGPPRAREVTGDISASTQRRLIQAGDYPKPVRVTEGRIAFRLAELLAWNRERIARARG